MNFKPDVVLHLAATVTIRGSIENFSEDAKQNFLGTANVLEASIKAKVKRFVFTSSMAVYDDAPTPVPLNEDWTKKPLSPYGISKYASEQLVHVMGKQANMETMVLRLFNTYGTGQASTPYVGVITIFIDKILSGNPPVIFGKGDQCRDFVYVGDVGRACKLAVESKVSGVTMNIGTGKSTTVNEIASLLLEKLNSSLIPEYKEIRNEENKNSIADISLAWDTIRYAPKFTLEEKISDVINFKRPH
jgi:UDP-glucose 4-epimerase